MQACTSHEQNVRPSVCPSNARIVTKRKHLAKKSSIMTNRSWPTSCSAVSLRQLSYLLCELHNSAALMSCLCVDIAAITQRGGDVSCHTLHSYTVCVYDLVELQFTLGRLVFAVRPRELIEHRSTSSSLVLVRVTRFFWFVS